MIISKINDDTLGCWLNMTSRLSSSQLLRPAFRRDPEALTGQLRGIVSTACPGPSQGTPAKYNNLTQLASVRMVTCANNV